MMRAALHRLADDCSQCFASVLRLLRILVGAVWGRAGRADLAIVDPLFVTRLAAEPLLHGAGRLDVACFAVGARWCRAERSQRHQQEERSGHEGRPEHATSPEANYASA
jgi:hypothetical protein